MKATTNCFLPRRRPQVGRRVAATVEIGDIGGLVIGGLVVGGDWW